jgi:hypothetical protein
MQRVYYIVSAIEGHAWAVGVEDEPPVKFADRQSAIDAAGSAASDLWERYGLPSGVRMVDPDGTEHETLTYGD